MNFYILDNEELKTVLSTDELGDSTAVLSANVSEKLDSYDILTLEIPADTEDSEHLKEDNTIVYEDKKGWREYIITEVEDLDSDSITRTVTAELSSIELIDEVVPSDLSGQNNPSTVLQGALSGTRWQVGTVDDSIYNSSFAEETKYKTVLEVLDLISQSFNCEVQFSYVVDRGKVVRRLVNLYKQFGEDTGKRFEVDKDVTSIKRIIDTTSLKTAIIPLGKLEEAEEGSLIDIKNVEWKKANGDPVDKPKGQNYIGHPDALAQWGRLNQDGTKRHRFTTVEMEVESASQLAQMAWVQLGSYINPKITYEADVVDLYALNGESEDFEHENVDLGDKVVVIDNYFKIPVVVHTRIVEMERDLLDPLNKKVVFGESLEHFSIGSVSDSVDQVVNNLAGLNREVALVRSTADGKNAVYFGSITPGEPNIGDLWYKPHPEKPNEKQMLIFNGTTWDVTNDSSRLADIEQEAIEVGKQLEVTKESVESAVSNADKAIEEVGFVKADTETALNRADSAISTANSAKSSAGSALTEAQKALTAYEKLEIGGRNYYTPGVTQLWHEGNGSYEVKPETPYGFNLTGSGTLSILKVITSNGYWAVSFDLKGAGNLNVDINDLGQKSFTATDEYQRVTLSVDVTNYEPNWSSFVDFESFAGADIWVKNIKVEKASKASDFTPSPEEIKVQITNINGELNRKVEQSTFNALDGTVKSHTTQISQNKDEISQKASQTSVNTLSGTVEQHETKISQNAQEISARLTSAQVDSLVTGKGYATTTELNATSSSLTSKISGVETDLANLDIGGRNLILDSNNPENWSSSKVIEDYALLERTGASAGDNRYSSVYKKMHVPILVPGEEYTFSIDLYIDSSVSLGSGSTLFIRYTKTTGSLKDFFLINLNTLPTDKWIRVKVTDKIDKDYPVFNNLTAAIAVNGKIRMRKPKLEKGTVATDHSPAPEDQATKTEFSSLEQTVNSINSTVGNHTGDISSINQTVSGINTTVSSHTGSISTLQQNVNGLQSTVSNKADKSQINQLSGQISAKVESSTYNSKMTQLDSAINLRVTANDVSTAILDDKRVKDTRSTNQNPSWYFSNYPRQTVEEFKQRTTLGAPGSQTYGLLTTEVPWSGSSGGHITQTFKSGDGIYRRTGTSTSWTAWDKIAEAGELISQINLSTEGILIQGKRIQLDGEVSMTSAFINRIKAIEISADRINGGTINGTNVNLINLNAKDIVTGTVSGTNSSWNLNTGQMEFINPSTGDQLRFTQGQIDFRNGAQGRYLKYNAEGLILEPFAGNTGTSKNTMLMLHGGGTGSYQYIQFVEGGTSTNYTQRLEAVGGNVRMLVANEFQVLKYGALTPANVFANGYSTYHSTGNTLYMTADRIETPRYGNRNIMISPQGTGIVQIANRDGAYYNIRASTFLNASSRRLKTNIENYDGSALSELNKLQVVTYNLKKDIEDGVDNTQIGFIAEDSLNITSVDGESIDMYKLGSLNTRAVQELSAQIESLKAEITELKGG